MEAGGKTSKNVINAPHVLVACPLAPDAAPYPRKGNDLGFLGPAERQGLMSDVDLWLCHNCGNCSDLFVHVARGLLP